MITVFSLLLLLVIGALLFWSCTSRLVREVNGPLGRHNAHVIQRIQWLNRVRWSRR